MSLSKYSALCGIHLWQLTTSQGQMSLCVSKYNDVQIIIVILHPFCSSIQIWNILHKPIIRISLSTTSNLCPQVFVILITAEGHYTKLKVLSRVAVVILKYILFMDTLSFNLVEWEVQMPAHYRVLQGYSLLNYVFLLPAIQ